MIERKEPAVFKVTMVVPKDTVVSFADEAFFKSLPELLKDVLYCISKWVW